MKSSKYCYSGTFWAHFCWQSHLFILSLYASKDKTFLESGAGHFNMLSLFLLLFPQMCVHTRERPYELTAEKHYKFVFSVVVDVFDSLRRTFFPFQPAPHSSSHWYKLFISLSVLSLISASVITGYFRH